MNDVAKNLYSKIYDLSNEIVPEIPNKIAFEHEHRKRSQYSMVIETETALYLTHVYFFLYI